MKKKIKAKVNPLKLTYCTDLMFVTYATLQKVLLTSKADNIPNSHSEFSSVQIERLTFGLDQDKGSLKL